MERGYGCRPMANLSRDSIKPRPADGDSRRQGIRCQGIQAEAKWQRGAGRYRFGAEWAGRRRRQWGRWSRRP
ncbi:hypothetical protein GCM10010350_34660 [Streptomyces galilaeus]|nr:hypothetical protein GCM10010350_34660 [Streptomyces galilaeus]